MVLFPCSNLNLPFYFLSFSIVISAHSLPFAPIHSDPFVPHLVNLKVPRIFGRHFSNLFFMCKLYDFAVLFACCNEGTGSECSFLYLFLISSDLNWILIIKQTCTDWLTFLWRPSIFVDACRFLSRMDAVKQTALKS